jgi:hypothetical protein
VIAKLNDQIKHFCHVYARARAAMVRLGANEQTLRRFQILLKEDIKASTAILNPNIPGSSSLRLSWIWNMESADAATGPVSMIECE